MSSLRFITFLHQNKLNKAGKMIKFFISYKIGKSYKCFQCGSRIRIRIKIKWILSTVMEE